MNRSRPLLLLLAGLVLSLTHGVADAQSPVDAARAEALKKVEAAKAAAASSSGTKKPEDAKSSSENKAGDEAKGESKDDKKEEDEPKVITRPETATADTPVDTAALRRQVGADGKVRFNLEGVPWPDLLQWLADVSSLSLDWQELPADSLNLRTQHPYSIDEARDVINRHLLARGFTMLKHEELLSVVNLKKLNPGLVPRVRPEELDERMPHEFVKTSFVLDWLIAEKAVEELKPMLSPNGKLTALTSTNRLEAIDAVVNLLEIRTVLAEEQTTTGEKRVIAVFHLEHVRADEAVALLEQILGMETARSMSGRIDDNASRQIMQQLQQMQKNMQRSSSSSSKGGGGEEAEPKLIVNERDNSIVAHAPPDKMEIIRQTITALDTPSARRGSTLHMKTFRLSSIDPASVVTILNELGDFSPSTRIQADESNSTLIVNGTLADLNSIWELIQELDGSTRSFDVIPLRRLAADEVAGTIQYLMGSEDDDTNDNSGYYSYYSYRYGSSSSSKTNEDKRPFKVDADIDNNRLLLWANEVEYKEVQDLLVKLGEIPSGEGSNETFRVIDLSSDEDADAVIERIRRMWPHLAPNELEIRDSTPADRGSSDPEQTPPSPSGRAPAAEELPASTGGIRTTSAVSPTHPLLLARSETPVRPVIDDVRFDRALPEFRKTPAPAPRFDVSQRSTTAVAANIPDVPPIVIQRAPDGKIILTSPDTRALDRLEEMLADVAPPRKDYHIFYLKYSNTWPYGIELTLRDIFSGEIESTTSYDPYWGTPITQKNSGGSRLSKRRPLRIISDSDSRTILVQGATASQLATISDLIDIYDQPTTSDPQALRVTKYFRLKYSNAATIADAIKSVHRDLLSTNDPALRDPNGDKENRPKDTGTTISYVYNRGSSGGEDDEREEPSRIEYDGLLSVGVDDISNTLIVSTIEGLMPEITEMVEMLDEAARPSNNFQVITLDPSINPALVQARLQKLLESQRPQPAQDGKQNGQPQPGGNGNGNNGRNGNNGGARNFGRN